MKLVRAAAAYYQPNITVTAGYREAPDGATGRGHQISLNWAADSDALSYRVWRKPRGSTHWTLLTATPLPDAAPGHIDTVPARTAYEYHVERDTGNFTSTAGATAHGYIHAGGKVPVNENRGRAATYSAAS